MKLKKFFFIVSLICLSALSIFPACSFFNEQEPPFEKLFTGITSSFDDSGEMIAVLRFSESEQAYGEIEIVKTSKTSPFRYSISDDGKISFTFDTEGDSASGTLYGKDIDVTATVDGEVLRFFGTFYLFTVKVNGEITEEGYVTAGHPLSDVETPPPETKSLLVNGVEKTVEEFMSMKMPSQDTVVEISDEDQTD